MNWDFILLVQASDEVLSLLREHAPEAGGDDLLQVAGDRPEARDGEQASQDGEADNGAGAK